VKMGAGIHTVAVVVGSPLGAIVAPAGDMGAAPAALASGAAAGKAVAPQALAVGAMAAAVISTQTNPPTAWL
jgi:hypothetical protein